MSTNVIIDQEMFELFSVFAMRKIYEKMFYMNLVNPRPPKSYFTLDHEKIVEENTNKFTKGK